jgi:hypothetical protein
MLVMYRFTTEGDVVLPLPLLKLAFWTLNTECVRALMSAGCSSELHYTSSPPFTRPLLYHIHSTGSDKESAAKMRSFYLEEIFLPSVRRHEERANYMRWMHTEIERFMKDTKYMSPLVLSVVEGDLVRN